MEMERKGAKFYDRVKETFVEEAEFQRNIQAA